MDKQFGFPNGTSYEFLYARYFDKGVEYIAKHITGFKVLDLCGGTGRLSKYLSQSGYDVTYLDICERMCLLDSSIPKIISTVEYFAKHNEYVFDSIVCMQAVNYWFNSTDIDKLSKHLNVGGKLIFNTFINRPSDEVSYKIYTKDGYDYEEEYCIEGNLIKHYQRVFLNQKMLDEHYSEFDYISKEEYLNKLKHSFDVEFIEDKGSAVVICTKK